MQNILNPFAQGPAPRDDESTGTLTKSYNIRNTYTTKNQSSGIKKFSSFNFNFDAKSAKGNPIEEDDSIDIDHHKIDEISDDD